MITHAFNYLTRLLLLKRDPIRFARSMGVRVGERCDFLNLELNTWGSEPYLIRIGDDVTISGPVRFITHDGGVRVIGSVGKALDVVSPIIIGSNVFIGINAIILPGVNIGDNCIVGAGSVVTRSIPEGNVVVGNPGRIIKTVNDYRIKVESTAFNIRGLSSEEKERFLRRYYAGKI